MKDGIYHVQFASALGAAGEGLVVVKDGSVNGGDAGYLYLGRLVGSEGTALGGQLHIKRWNPAHVSVFGPIDSFALNVTGQTSAANDSFTVSGGMPGQPGMSITIRGRRLAEAA